MSKNSPFHIKRKICFYETDGMGVVHHSNYLRFFEEARMHWFNARDIKTHDWEGLSPSSFAVIDCHMKHYAPARYNEEIEIRLQACQDGGCLRFQYVVLNHVGKTLTSGSTVHAAVTKDLKAVRLPKSFREILKGESWTEIWP